MRPLLRFITFMQMPMWCCSSPKKYLEADSTYGYVLSAVSVEKLRISIKFYSPLLQLVKIASSVNSSQHNGSGSICLDYQRSV